VSQFKKYASSLIFIIVLSVFIVLRGPAFYNNWKWQGAQLKPLNVINIVSNEHMTLFKNGQNEVVVFWASWCGPCMIEFDRFKSSIEAGKIPSSNVYAFNPFESVTSIKKFAENKKYPFQFVSDGGVLAHKLQVRLTPTTLLLKNGILDHMSSGVSPFVIRKAENMFSK